MSRVQTRLGAQRSVGRLALRAAAALAAAVLCADAWGATRIDLDPQWQFRVDPDQFGESFGWSSKLPSNTESIRVPHTWNVGRLHDYLGVAWYFRQFDRPAPQAGSHVELHFGATFYRARVWLNGVELGQHEGGFTAYAFDVTPLLRDSNLLVVRVDNRPSAHTIPGFGERGAPGAWYDWWTYGGIVRDVWLSAAGPARVAHQSVHSEQQIGHALIVDRIHLQNDLQAASLARLEVTVYGPDAHVVAREVRSLSLAPGPSDETVRLTWPRPQLWSIDHPYLYRVAASLVDASGAALDRQELSFGVRTIQIKDQHLLINGERVRLTGLARHEDSPAEGLAESTETMRRDLDDMKALHTTLSRPVHYPQNPFILDYADQHGILLIPEIPVWQFSEAQLSDPVVLRLAQQQLREMIEEAGQHPSIFAWSVANESAMATPGGIAYFRKMRELARELDPDRPVSFADDNLPKLSHADESAANDADFLLMNQYFGSWHGPTAALEPALDHVHQLYPDKLVIVSEFGYPGPFAPDAIEADRRRAQTIREQLPLMASRDWIAGAILWCYQDYKSRRNLWPEEVEGFVDHGVVDAERRERPSYAVWKELNAPLHIDAHWEPAHDGAPRAFALDLIPNSERELPYYPLHGYRVGWRITDGEGREVTAGGQALADLARSAHIAGRVPGPRKQTALSLDVSVSDVTGTVLARRTINWPDANGPALH